MTGLLLVYGEHYSLNIAVATINSICIVFLFYALDMLDRRAWKADCKLLKHLSCICALA